MLFDAGRTLIRSRTSAAEVAREVLETHGIEVPSAGVEKAMADATRRVEASWLREDWWRSEGGVRRLFVTAYRASLAQALNLDPGEELPLVLADGVYDTYQETRHWAAYPEVPGALRRLQDAGLRLGVVSDWGQGLQGILLDLRLGQYFEFVVVSARLGVSKPDPRVFQMALDRLGATPEEAVYIGDTYVKDVLGARAAGICPVLLDRQASAPAVDCAHVADLEGLVRLVGAERVPPPSGHGREPRP